MSETAAAPTPRVPIPTPTPQETVADADQWEIIYPTDGEDHPPVLVLAIGEAKVVMPIDGDFADALDEAIGYLDGPEHHPAHGEVGYDDGYDDEEDSPGIGNRLARTTGWAQFDALWDRLPAQYKGAVILGIFMMITLIAVFAR